MSVVEIDDRGRFTIPKEIGLRGRRAVILSSGSFFVVIPLQGDPYDYAKGWLKTGKSVRDLKDLSDAAASDDAYTRANRRK